MVNKALLIYHCSIKGITISKLADLLGISRSAMYRKLNNESDFYRHEIISIRDILGLSLKETMEIFFNEELA